MATNQNQGQLRQQALDDLAASRAEIHAGMHKLGQELNPKLVMHRIVDRHKVAAASFAVAAGLVSALLIFRSKRHVRPDVRRTRRHAEQATVEPKIGSVVMRAAAGSLISVLLKSVVISPLLESLAHPKSDGYK